MQAKKIVKSKDCRAAILSGVEQLYSPVASTLGPKGRNIIIEGPNGRPTVTKDGVTVAEEIELPDPIENLGAQLVKDAARNTNALAGDGTTTATILAYHMMKGSLEFLGKSANPILIKRGMDKCVALIAAELKKMAKPVESKDDYEAVATISSQDPEIGKMIADVIDEGDDDGVVIIEKGHGMGLESRFVKGMQFESGYRSAYFVNNTDNMTVELENCAVIVTSARITNINQILQMLEGLAQKQLKNVAIIADDFEPEVLEVMILNKRANMMSPVAIKAPGYKKNEVLKDIAVSTGATFLSQEEGSPVEKGRLDDVGYCKKLTVTRDLTTITEGTSDHESLKARIDEIKAHVKTLESEYDIEQASKRIARLTSGIGIISVGGATEVEATERMHRVEDALSAVRAASVEGIVPGGGTALIRAASLVEKSRGPREGNIDEAAGFTIVLDAITKPLSIIAENAGEDVLVVLKKVQEGKDNYGFNALTGVYEDLLLARVIDPTLVTRSALENAASVASMFVTLEGAITNIPLNTQEKALQAMMGPRQPM